MLGNFLTGLVGKIFQRLRLGDPKPAGSAASRKAVQAVLTRASVLKTSAPVAPKTAASKPAVQPAAPKTSEKTVSSGLEKVFKAQSANVDAIPATEATTPKATVDTLEAAFAASGDKAGDDTSGQDQGDQGDTTTKLETTPDVTATISTVDVPASVVAEGNVTEQAPEPEALDTTPESFATPGTAEKALDTEASESFQPVVAGDENPSPADLWLESQKKLDAAENVETPAVAAEAVVDPLAAVADTVFTDESDAAPAEPVAQEGAPQDVIADTPVVEVPVAETTPVPATSDSVVAPVAETQESVYPVDNFGPTVWAGWQTENNTVTAPEADPAFPALDNSKRFEAIAAAAEAEAPAVATPTAEQPAADFIAQAPVAEPETVPAPEVIAPQSVAEAPVEATDWSKLEPAAVYDVVAELSPTLQNEIAAEVHNVAEKSGKPEHDLSAKELGLIVADAVGRKAEALEEFRNTEFSETAFEPAQTIANEVEIVARVYGTADAVKPTAEVNAPSVEDILVQSRQEALKQSQKTDAAVKQLVDAVVAPQQPQTADVELAAIREARKPDAVPSQNNAVPFARKPAPTVAPGRKG